MKDSRRRTATLVLLALCSAPVLPALAGAEGTIDLQVLRANDPSGNMDSDLCFLVSTTVPKSVLDFPVFVEIRDEDGGASGGSNAADVNPLPGKRQIDVTFNACQLCWFGDVSGGPGPELYRGFQSEWGEVVFDITTGDGKPFSPDDVALAGAAPVRVVPRPDAIVGGKATATAA